MFYLFKKVRVFSHYSPTVDSLPVVFHTIETRYDIRTVENKYDQMAAIYFNNRTVGGLMHIHKLDSL